MPFVDVHTVRGLLSDEKKRELQDRITDLLVEIEGRGDPSFRRLVWVEITEADPVDWSLGGVHVTPQLIEQVASKKDGG
jgi:4-oxalocrotonate tautomerase